MMVAVIRKQEQKRKEEEKEKERLRKRKSSASSSRTGTSMSYYRSNSMYGSPSPPPPYELPGPFRHMTNPYADVEDLDSRPVSRGGWATHPSQLPPLRGTPRDSEAARPASRSELSPRPVSKSGIFSRAAVSESSRPPTSSRRESAKEADSRPKTALNRRESRPGTSISRPRNFPPQLPSGGEFPLYYVDISPSGLRASTDMTASMRYDRFDVLVGKANAWLAANPDVFVINCETVETRSDDEEAPVDTSLSTAYDDGQQSMYYHRSLRIWIRTRKKTDPPGPQSINFINLVPQCFNPEGFNYMESPDFETLKVAISKLNTTLSNAPLKGRVINMETVYARFTWGKDMPDLDRCQWEEDGHRSTYSVAAIRVFYQDKIRSAQQTIGIMDFVPNQVKPASGFTPAVYDTIETTVDRVNSWLVDQDDVSIVNLQTLEHRTEATLNGRKVDTTVALNRDSRSSKTSHLRFVRVYLTREPFNTQRITDLSDDCKLPLCLSYRTFQPDQLQHDFESQRKTLQQAVNWVRQTDAKVACCETVQVRIQDNGTGLSGDPEVTLTQNSNTGEEHIKYVHRVFLDGIYQNPVQVNETSSKVNSKSRSCVIL